VDIGLALTYVTRDPQWVKKVLIGGLSALFVLAFAVPYSREFFALILPSPLVFFAAIGIVGVTGALIYLVLRALGWVKAFPALRETPVPPEVRGWNRLKQRIVEKSGWNRSFPTTTEINVIVPPKPSSESPDTPDD